MRVSGIRERFGDPLYDTYEVARGGEHKFLKDDLAFLNNGPAPKERTNMPLPGFLKGDDTYIVEAIGLRLLGKTRDEEYKLLDHLIATPTVGDKTYGYLPGNLCSTYRLLPDDEPLTDDDFIPGYVLPSPLMIPTRMGFHLDVVVSESLPVDSIMVRAFFLGRRTRPTQ